MALEIVRSSPVIEDVLATWSASVGGDLAGYRGHVYRMFNFCRALLDDAAYDERIAIAAVHHDLGIWSDGTFDYLAPSAARAEAYLAASGRADDVREVTDMIVWHHRLRSCSASGGARGGSVPSCRSRGREPRPRPVRIAADAGCRDSRRVPERRFPSLFVACRDGLVGATSAATVPDAALVTSRVRSDTPPAPSRETAPRVRRSGFGARRALPQRGERALRLRAVGRRRT